MSTERKLWWGFGTLVAVLLLSSLAILLRLGSIDTQMTRMVAARNLSATASQLEISALSQALAVRTYLQNGDLAPLQQAADNAVALEQQLLDYEGMALSPAQRATAQRFRALWRELQTLTQALLDPDNRQLKLEHSRRLYDLATALKKILNEEIQLDAVREYDARRLDAMRDARSATLFALVLLILGSGIAVTTSITVGRGVVRAERRLQESREQLRVTLASIGDAVITTDTQGHISYLNRVAETLLGVAADAVRMQRLDQHLHLLRVDTREALPDPSALVLDQDQAHTQTQQLLWRPDGREVPVDSSAAPIRDEQGRVAGTVLVLRDTTERMHLENELRRSAADLSEADRRKDEFLAMLAHELRNPLAPISNSLQLLRRTAGTSEAVRGAVEMMSRQTAQIVRLVDDLLDVSRISRGKIELRRTRVDLRAILRQAAETVRPLCAAQSQVLHVNLADEPLFVHGDAARLTQVVGNLLNNAAKFSAPGGALHLHLDTVDGEAGGEARIRVRDSGIGISAEQMPRIFDLFVQADTSLGRRESGVGIGLALVRSLVEMHEGRVEAHSEGLGQGAEFTVHLPLPVPGQDDGSAPAPAAPRATAPLRVLVVDDNLDAAESMAALLELDGHVVRTSADGLDAVAQATAWKPDALLLDIGLPGLTGYEVARRIRAQDWGREVRLIALTGWGQSADRERSAEAGFDDHLVKPASQASVQRVLAKKPA